MKLNALHPMLSVSNINKSLEFYERALGFERLNTDKELEEWKWAHIKSGNVALMLSQSGSPVHPEGEHDFNVLFYFYPDDVEALHAKLSEAGFPVTELTVTFYGMKEFLLKDPDGHLLSFGQHSDEPPTGCDGK